MNHDAIRKQIHGAVRLAMESAERLVRSGTSIHARQGGKPSGVEQAQELAEALVMGLVRQGLQGAAVAPDPPATPAAPAVPNAPAEAGGFVLPPGCEITAGWMSDGMTPRLQIRFPIGNAEPCKAAAELLRARMAAATPPTHEESVT